MRCELTVGGITPGFRVQFAALFGKKVILATFDPQRGDF